MRERKFLTAEKAEAYLNWYRVIFGEIELYGNELLFAIFQHLRHGGETFEFRGHELGIKEFWSIVEKYNGQPEKLEVLMQAGKSAADANALNGSATSFLKSLPYVEYIPPGPEIDELMKCG